MYHKKNCEVQKNGQFLKFVERWGWKMLEVMGPISGDDFVYHQWTDLAKTGRRLFSQKNRNIIYPDLPSGNLTYGESLKITLSNRCIIYKLAIFNMLTQGLISKKCFRKKTEKKAAWVRPQSPHAIEILRPVGSLSRRVGPLHLFFKSSFWGTTTDAWVI